MDDQRIEEFERALWVGEGDIYRRCVSDDAMMVVPREPFAMRGSDAKDLLEQTPRWSEVRFSDMQVSRPQDGLISIAYRADASLEGEAYTAYCTTTMQRQGEHEWQVIQHQQTVPASV